MKDPIEIDLDKAGDTRIVVREGGVIVMDVPIRVWMFHLATFGSPTLPCCHWRRLNQWVDGLETACGDTECCS